MMPHINSIHLQKRALLASAVTLGTSLFLIACNSDSKNAADIVFKNGYVYTVNAKDSVAQSVAVRDGKILYVGSNDSVDGLIDKHTEVIDLAGKMLMPGFIDAHLHALAGGRAQLQCDLAYAPLSQAELRDTIQSCLDASASKEPDGWLEVVNWDRYSTAAKDGDPTKALLDALETKRPIVITASDFHSVLANSRALAIAGITAETADPAGGAFAHDENGELTGIAEDNAGFQLKSFIPADSDADQVQQASSALETLRNQGVTTFMDASAGEAQGKAFKTLREQGKLTARTFLAIGTSTEEVTADPAKAMAAAAQVAKHLDEGETSPTPGINSRMIKIFLDGVINAPADTGAMLTPYYTNTGTDSLAHWEPGTNHGSLYYPAEILKPLTLAAADLNMDLHIHATGERSVREMLNAIAYEREQRPNLDFRPSIAHDESVTIEDYARFAPLDVTATMSFQWGVRAPYSIGDTENHLGPDRFSRMEPSGSLANAGARVAYGRDWPIDPHDIFLALKAGVTRSGDNTNPNSAAFLSPKYEGKLNAEPTLTRAQSLRAITMNSAYQLRMEDKIGSIEQGKYADLIVLEKNFMTEPEEELARNKVLLTMVGGKIVMANDELAKYQEAQ